MGRQKSALAAWLEYRPLLAPAGALILGVLVIAVAALLLDSRIERLEDTLRYAPGVHLPANAGAEMAAGVREGHLLYVPAYSHIYSRGGKANLLEITLSIRNTDLHDSVTLVSVDYYDTSGKQVRSFLQQPVRLGPLATKEFLVEERDAQSLENALRAGLGLYERRS